MVHKKVPGTKISAPRLLCGADVNVPHYYHNIPEGKWYLRRELRDLGVKDTGAYKHLHWKFVDCPACIKEAKMLGILSNKND